MLTVQLDFGSFKIRTKNLRLEKTIPELTTKLGEHAHIERNKVVFVQLTIRFNRNTS